PKRPSPSAPPQAPLPQSPASVHFRHRVPSSERLTYPRLPATRYRSASSPSSTRAREFHWADPHSLGPHPLATLEKMDTLLREVRYSTRKLLRTPAFTAIVVGTLSLAIGATTAVFSIVNGILLEPLPLRDPSRVVAVS